MTPAEITDLVTQTAIEGFDPNNPFTWQWGALALGGQTILAAGSIVAGAKGEKQDIKKQARKFGQAIGRLLDDL